MYTIRILRKADEIEITCGSDENILKAMERAKCAEKFVGCRCGGCGICKVQILEGKVTCGKMNHSHACLEEQEKGIVLACRVKPRSDIILRFIGLSEFI